MTEKKKYPAAYICGEKKLTEYKKHLDPLDIKAKGDVLIIGAGVSMEEVGAIEQEIVNGDVKNIWLVGEDCDAQFNTLLYYYPADYPKIHQESSTWQWFFQHNFNLTFDTIMFTGVPSYRLPTKDIIELATYLNYDGRFYATINVEHSKKVPSLLNIPDCKTKIIPKIPANPNYFEFPHYYGLIVEKVNDS